VIMYADRITGSMERCIGETNRRREIQQKHNEDNGITPEGIQKAIAERMSHEDKQSNESRRLKMDINKIPKDEYNHVIKDLESQMDLASKNLEFEKAADLRDLIAEIKAKITK
jgi:excinuclease ABC subunit B